MKKPANLGKRMFSAVVVFVPHIVGKFNPMSLSFVLYIRMSWLHYGPAICPTLHWTLFATKG